MNNDYAHRSTSDGDDKRKRNRRVIILGTALVVSMTVMFTAMILLLFGGSFSGGGDESTAAGLQETASDQTNDAPVIATASSPSLEPSVGPSMTPTLFPTFYPSIMPSMNPFAQPSRVPSDFPSSIPSDVPSQPPSTQPTWINATYTPGRLTVSENNLLLSEGLTSRVLAESGKPVVYAETTSGEQQQSVIPFHVLPDFGATFPDPRTDYNAGGWIYVSNSEVKDFEQYSEKGGVGALTMGADGNVIDYRMVLEGTEANCGGGRTAWGAWISCEEHEQGAIWQVDPTGEREAQRITLGSDDGGGGGAFESFASHGSHFFVTEDAESGPLRRFTPTPANTNWTDPWSILLGPGLTEYLMLYPEHGIYNWTTDKELAKDNSKLFYRNSEGIDVAGNQLFFVSKVQKELLTLDLTSSQNYTVETTEHGLFDGQPDQIMRIVGDDELLFFTEEGGSNAGGK